MIVIVKFPLCVQWIVFVICDESLDYLFNEAANGFEQVNVESLPLCSQVEHFNAIRLPTSCNADATLAAAKAYKNYREWLIDKQLLSEGSYSSRGW